MMNILPSRDDSHNQPLKPLPFINFSLSNEYHVDDCGFPSLKSGVNHKHLTSGIELKKLQASEPAPILDFNQSLKSPDKLRAVKCRCNKSWCPTCSKNTIIKTLADRIRDWDWQRVRQVVLTLDRRQFESAEVAYDYITEHKKLPNLFRNLERTLGIVAVDWVRVVEWHKDGYPHWHILVLAEKARKAGQIGGDNLRRYWPWGAVRESYIHSKKHWLAFVGYFQKHGYFEHKKGKKHQVELPEWARERKSVIRRIGSKSLKSMTEEEKLKAKIKRDVKKIKEWAPAFEHYVDPSTGYNPEIAQEIEDREKEREKLKQMTQGEKLELCGSSVDIYDGGIQFDNQSFVCKLKVPYNEFLKKVPGEFVPSMGYVFDKQFINQFEVG